MDKIRHYTTHSTSAVFAITKVESESVLAINNRCGSRCDYSVKCGLMMIPFFSSFPPHSPSFSSSFSADDKQGSYVFAVKAETVKEEDFTVSYLVGNDSMSFDSFASEVSKQ